MIGSTCRKIPRLRGVSITFVFTTILDRKGRDAIVVGLVCEGGACPPPRDEYCVKIMQRQEAFRHLDKSVFHP